MKRIPLTQGKYTLVDDADFTELTKLKWHFQCGGAYTNVKVRSGVYKRLAMHRLLLKPSPELQVDHKNHDRLDNQRSNLRVATVQENLRNRRPCTGSKSGYKGVGFDPKQDNWFARIYVDKRPRYLGSFATPQEAAIAYNRAAKQYFGEFAWLNPIRDLLEANQKGK